MLFTQTKLIRLRWAFLARHAQGRYVEADSMYESLLVGLEQQWPMHRWFLTALFDQEDLASSLYVATGRFAAVVKAVRLAA